MKRQKLYYVPGLLSLLCLPMLLLLAFPEKPVKHTVIRMYIPNDEKPVSGFTSFSTYTVLQKVKTKHVISVNLEKDTSDDMSFYNRQAKLHFIRNEIERLTFTHATNAVLQVSFGATTTYADFISIMNQLLICEVKQYALVGNNFYIFANKLPPAHPEAINSYPYPLIYL
jgi:hypothetical protein